MIEKRTFLRRFKQILNSLLVRKFIFVIFYFYFAHFCKGNLARKACNFKEADRLREDLRIRGIALLDEPGGTFLLYFLQ